MLPIAAAFAPIWLIAGCGWIAVRTRLVETAAQRALTGFAFNIAMPAVLFVTLSRARLDQIPVRPLAALAAGTVLVGGAAVMLARWRFRDRAGGQIMTAMAAGYLNSGNLGIPLAVQVLDDTLLIAAVIMFQTVVITPMVMLAMDALGDRGAGGGRWRLWLAPLRNPIVLAATAGLLLNAAGVSLADAWLAPVEILGASAVPVALFALGMSLRLPGGRPPSGHWRAVAMVSALKAIAHPLLAYAVGRFLLGIDGPALFAVMLIAALPTAQVVFVYADRFNARVDLARDVVMVTSLAAMLTLAGIAAMFGFG